MLAGQVGEGGLQLFVPEPEEAVLIGADLVEVQVRLTGVEKLANRRHDRVEVGAAGHRPGRVGRVGRVSQGRSSPAQL